MNVIILLGAPGSGKGTIASGLVENEPLWYHVSSGDMLRAAVKEHTPVGREAEDYMLRGALVPDELITALIVELMGGIDAGSTLLLDGFPRTVRQVTMLDKALLEHKANLQAVVCLEVPEEELIDRIAGRRICRQCGSSYHVTNIKPKREGICDNCGGTLVARADDNIETVKHRLETYRNQTMPLIDIYTQRNKIRQVNGVGSISKTVERVKEVL